MERTCQPAAPGEVSKCGRPMTYLKDDFDPYLPEGQEQMEIWQCPVLHQHTFPKG